MWGAKEGIADGAAIENLKSAWAKNKVRPGGVGLRGRN